MEKNTGWKRIVYLMCAIQVGAGIAMIGVMAFLPLFLGEIGVTDAGEAGFLGGAHFRGHAVYELLFPRLSGLSRQTAAARNLSCPSFLRR